MPYPQVTYPPPHVGYDHNWVLFGLGMDAANKTHIGAVSSECAMLHKTSQLLPSWPTPVDYLSLVSTCDT